MGDWLDAYYEIKRKYPKNSYLRTAKLLIRRGYFKDYIGKEVELSHYIESQVKQSKEPNVRYNESSIEYNALGNLTSNKVISICKDTHDITTELIMKLHDIDPTKWEVVSYKNNYWQSQQQGGQIIDLYQSKLVVKPIVELLKEDRIKSLFESLDRQYKEDVKPVTVQKFDKESKLVEVNISDMHLGKYYFDDVSNIRYDTKMSIKHWNEIIEKTVQRLSIYNVDYINFIWCNDFFNSDGKGKTTTSGTPQDTDLDYQELFDIGVKLLVKSIETLKHINPNRTTPVKLFYLPSNHDEMMSWYAIMFLKAWFKDDPYVTLDISKYPRKYVLYGKTLLGYGHGDRKLPPNRASALMPLEAAEMWSKARYKEFHLAHLHSEHMIEEINGVLVRRTSSPTFPDLYHIENGFVGNEQKIQVFIYDKESGLETIHNIRV